MKITQIRNATIVVEFGEVCLLVDPMLAEKGALPALKFFDGKRQKNPIVELPSIADKLLEKVTHCLITHCQKGHFDHLDNAAKRWLREHQTPIFCTRHDAVFLKKRGLNVLDIEINHQKKTPFFNGSIQSVACQHGKGMVGLLMEHGVGYFIQIPNEPSLYLSGDTLLTDEVLQFVKKHQPEINVIPVGGASFDIGGDIIMGLVDAVDFLQCSDGIVIANHLEALSHCPVRRIELLSLAKELKEESRLKIPYDGESISIVT